MCPLDVEPRSLRYSAMIGVGGIGTGVFFALDGNRTLGREESRSGRFMDRRDYCKLHIVSHYVKALCGPGFDVIPVGKVGDDVSGRKLFEEMEEAGLNIEFVERSKDDQTLFSFCYIYPDGSGGNMTTADSACSRVTPEYVTRALPAFERYKGKGIALAVPEVPLEARLALLELGSRYSFFRAASFTSKEIEDVKGSGVFAKLDLRAVNIDEASRFGAFEFGGGHKGLAEGRMNTAAERGAGCSGEESRLFENGGEKSVGRKGHMDRLFADTAGREEKRTPSPEAEVERAVSLLSSINKELLISVTAGRRESWVWDGKRISFFPAPPVKAVATAGAGDAFLAGFISGVASGLALTEAQELATLVAAFSVTSPHTIHKGLNRESLAEFSITTGLLISLRVKTLLGTG